jgi:integrase
MNIPKKNAKLQTIVDFYLNSRKFAKLSGSTQKDYEYQLSSVCDTVVEGKRLGDYRLKSIKVRHLTQAYEVWTETGVRSANYRRGVLSAAWKHSMRYDVMSHNPVSLIQTETAKDRRVFWTRDQISAFLSTAYSNYSWRSIGLILHMAYDWGQRLGDMRLLTWDALDLDGCRLDITQSKRNAEVHLPIASDLCKMLQQQKEDFGFQDYVAPRVRPRAGAYTPYNKEEISPLINEILEEANLPHELTGMDLRRTAVTEMMEGGANVTEIMQVTGHKNVASLRPYMVNTLSGASKALATRGNNEDEHS